MGPSGVQGNIHYSENSRLELEGNVEKLRKSLKQWQKWDSEYEDLMEEISAFKGSDEGDELSRIGREFGGEILNETEINDLLRTNQGQHRSSKQVLDLLTKRLEYVQRNIRTIEKQLEAMEGTKETGRPESLPDAVLPLTEIREELDEDGNIISATTSRAEDSMPQVQDFLAKAGVKDLKETTSQKFDDALSSQPAPVPPREYTRNEPELHDIAAKNAGIANTSSSKAEMASTETPPSGRTERNPFTSGTETGSHSKPPITPRLKDDLKTQHIPHSPRAIHTIDRAENKVEPVLTPNESEADAALRREMIEYSLSEMGSVVAELEIEETDSDFDYLDEDMSAASAEDDEDDYGRTTRKVVSDNYRQKMAALEKSLGASMIENAGPAPPNIPATEPTTITGETTTRGPQTKRGKSNPTVKKGVRFAEQLEVSKSPEAVNATPLAKKKQHSVPPLREAIVEKAAAEPRGLESSSIHSTRQSKFKAGRASLTQSPFPTTSSIRGVNRSSSSAINNPPELESLGLPTGPHPAADEKSSSEPARINLENKGKPLNQVPTGRILSDEVTEHEQSCRPSDSLYDADLDQGLLQQEVATKYHQMRNRMIQQQGGFIHKDEELERIPFSEEEGGPKKVSLFKAARLKR